MGRGVKWRVQVEDCMKLPFPTLTEPFLDSFPSSSLEKIYTPGKGPESAKEGAPQGPQRTEKSQKQGQGWTWGLPEQ